MSATLKLRGAKAAPSLADIGYLSNFAGSADGYILISDLIALGLGTYFEDAGGWIVGEAWTYVSANSLSAAGDLTGKYAKGDRIRLTNAATTKYFYVVGVSFGAGITTLTLAAGSDYALAVGAISAPSYSKQATPAGFPQWFTWAATPAGFSANPSGVLTRFQITGRTCLVELYGAGGAGTSNATNLTYTLPVTAANAGGGTMFWIGTARGYNSGAYVTSMSFCLVNTASPTLWQFFPSNASTAWGATLGKFIEYAACSYEF